MRFRGLLVLREIDVGGDLDANVVLADDRLQDVGDPLDDARFNFLNVLDLRWIEAGFHQLALELGKHGAALVNQRDAGDGQIRHAGSDQVLDAGDLRRIELASGIEVD